VVAYQPPAETGPLRLFVTGGRGRARDERIVPARSNGWEPACGNRLILTQPGREEDMAGARDL